MELEEIAQKFHTYNGMKLVDFSEVALPIYRVTSTALVQEKVDLPTIEEFVLRSIFLGFKDIEEIYMLLGISQDIVKAALSGLIQSDLIAETFSGSVKLTSTGATAAGEYSKTRPMETQVTFDFDGLIRKVRFTTGDPYLSPKEVKDQGLIEIRAIPARKPSEDEVDLQDVGRFLARYTSVGESNKTLLRIREITRAVRLFYKAVMLVYKNKEDDHFEAAFFIDGKLSEGHGLAFIRSDGLNRLGLLKEIHNNNKDILKAEYPDYLFEKQKTGEKNNSLKSTKRNKGTLSLNKGISEENDSVVELAEIKNLGDRKSLVRTLPVYEHPKILNSSLRDAKNKLVIISPWITRAVVNKSFTDLLEKLLKNGVDIKIGFGIGEDDRKDYYAQNLLENLVSRYDNFTLKNLGNTHAKVLIKDDDYYVITSFNWLSFKGDPKKKFREEWGNYIEDPVLVSEFYSEIKKRFD